MKAESWVRVLDLFREVVELEVEQRERVLAERCSQSGDGDDVRREVERLLAEDRVESGPLDGAAAGPVSELFTTAPALDARTRVGSCVIERLIASGGMGTVYEAVQDAPRRRVALKTLRPGLGSSSRLRRFRLEAELLGRLDHPGIAEVHEFGTHEGRPDESGAAPVPYLVMELVEDARDLVAWANETGLSVEDRVRLFLEVCEAVAHGHQRGVLHCDLKPSNLLVGRDGRPKVIDFGVSRVLDGERAGLSSLALLTAGSERAAGTLLYMAPEQLAGRASALDVRCDVCALGTVLFELLSGELPFDVGELPLLEVVRAMSEREPRRLADVADVPTELSWITARALDRDPEHRYATVQELASDLRRFLAHEPVLAGPPSATYRLRKLVRRNRASFAVAALVLGVALVGTWSTLREARAAAVQLEIATEATGFLEAALLGLDPEEARGREVTLASFLDATQTAIEASEDLHPEVELQVRSTLGRAYLLIRRFELAVPELRRAHELLCEVEGERARETLEAGLLLAEARLGLPGADGELAELVTATARDANAALGADDASTLQARVLEGVLAGRRYELDEAVRLLEAAASASEAALGPQHPVTLEARRQVVDAYLLRGDKAEAFERFDALRPDRPALEEESPGRTVRALDDAAVLSEMSRLDDALELVGTYLPRAREVLGADAPIVARAGASIGHDLARAGRTDEALRHLERTFDALELVEGRESRDHVEAMGVAAAGLVELGRLAEAEPWLQRAAALHAASGARDSVESFQVRLVLGNVLSRRNLSAEAAATYQSVLDDARALLGARHPFTLLAANNLTTAWSHLGRMREAEALSRESARAAVESFGPDDPDHALFLRESHGVMLRKLGRYDEAREVLEDTLTRRSRVLGPEHADTLKTRYELAVLWHHEGRVEDAADELAALAVDVERIGDPDLIPRVAEARAHALADLGRTAESLHWFDQRRGGYSIEGNVVQAHQLALTGEGERARGILDHAVQLADGAFEEGHWLRALAQGARARTLRLLGDDLGREPLRAWVEATSATFGAEAYETRRARRALEAASARE